MLRQYAGEAEENFGESISMSVRSASLAVQIAPMRCAVVWLVVLPVLTGPLCHAEESAELASPNSLPAFASSEAVGLHRYNLPRSNNHSIYFLPGSAELSESARQALSDSATRLNAIPQLVVMLEGYSDEFEDAAHGPGLRKARVEAVIEGLLERNIPMRRIVTTNGHDAEQTSAFCTSEYCRQSYRRVGLEFSRTAGR